MNRSSLRELRHHSVFRYLVSGGSAFVMEYGSFLILFKGLALPLVAANTISFLIGLATSFIIGRTWAFKQDTFAHKARHQALMYVVLAGVNVLLSNGIIWLLDSLGLDARIGKVIAIGFVAVWNFFIFKYVIFRRDRSAPADQR